MYCSIGSLFCNPCELLANTNPNITALIFTFYSLLKFIRFANQVTIDFINNNHLFNFVASEVVSVAFS
ncbi:hypothetical protein BD0136_07390 [Helicobacter pylori]